MVPAGAGPPHAACRRRDYGTVRSLPACLLPQQPDMIGWQTSHPPLLAMPVSHPASSQGRPLLGHAGHLAAAAFPGLPQIPQHHRHSFIDMVTSAAATPKAAAAWRARAASLPLQPFSPARLQQPLGGRRGHVATREKLRCAASTSSSGGGGGSSGSAALPQQQSAARSSVPAGAAASTPSVCVVGGGVIGLTSALRIKQALPAAEVTVVAEAFEATTSHGAAGLWKPYTLVS